MIAKQMPTTRRELLKRTATLPAFLTAHRISALASAETTQRRIATGPFQPTWDSLKQYKAPEWFRDAKFGMWAHWSAQCVPESGDWYARQMYMQGSRDYKTHIEHYGHPSQTGFMEIDNLWKAER